MRPMQPRRLVGRARGLRRRSTWGEEALWSVLRGRRFGWKFRRQHPIGSRIADFACPELRVVVEIDGVSHRSRHSDDMRRERQIEALGWQIIRVAESAVLADRVKVARGLAVRLGERAREMGVG